VLLLVFLIVDVVGRREDEVGSNEEAGAQTGNPRLIAKTHIPNAVVGQLPHLISLQDFKIVSKIYLVAELQIEIHQISNKRLICVQIDIDISWTLSKK
jgi:hypothetical protein